MAGALLFDLDGTLVDTAPDFARILNAQRRDLHLPAIAAERVRHWVSQGARHVVASGFADYSAEPERIEQLRQDFLDRYAREICVHSCLFPGMRELLAQLAQRAIAWGIVTNKPERYTLPLLAQLQLHPGTVICPDHVPSSKPDPAGLLLACQQLDRSVHASLYVGDHERDIEAGRRAGMGTVAVSWGYTLEGDDPKRWRADHLIQHPQQLSSLFHLIEDSSCTITRPHPSSSKTR